MGAFDARWTAGKTAPSADCLSDLAADAGLAERSLPAYQRSAAVLPMMGRFDQALAPSRHGGQTPMPRPALLRPVWPMPAFLTADTA